MSRHTTRTAPSPTVGDELVAPGIRCLRGGADLLPDRERVLGADHPDTLITRYQRVYWAQDPDVTRAFALEHLGDCHVREDPAMAEHYYRRLLAEYPTLSGTSPAVEVSLANLLIDKGDQASLEESFALLNSYLECGFMQFPSNLFRWHLARIRIAQATDDKETVRRSARTALDLANRGPVLPRHMALGVVQADEQTLERLPELAK